jgi:glutathione peroxidase
MSLTSFTVNTIQGVPQALSVYEGKVLLVVNVASKCGFTGQYAGLQSLHQEYASRGLVVMGFPCDQFGHQEPGNESSILTFCETQYKVSFPMFAKIEVNGAEASPFYQWLKTSKPGLLGTEAIKWNFTKFLVSRKGQVIKRYAPTDTPESLRTEIEQALAL